MSTSVSASAPGKVVLSGEYAVLDDAPAICMAVNRRAIVTMHATHGDESNITAPGFSDEGGRFRIGKDKLSWIDGEDTYAVLDAAWRVSDRRPGSAVRLELDSSHFMDAGTRRKLGIGSSAAVAVALCALMNSEQSVAKAAFSTHDALHGISGSGVDVACSLHGGLLEYFRDQHQVTALSWPQRLQFRLIWTGVAASTAAKLAALESSDVLPTRARLGHAARSLADCWHSGDAQAIVDEYSVYVDCLQRFSVEHKLGIFDAGHAELMNTATAAGLTYKPCGAGGGDVGILLGTDDGKLDTFTRSLPEQFAVIDCAMDSSGYRIEEQA